jgi:hypothetical protein
LAEWSKKVDDIVPLASNDNDNKKDIAA